MAKAKKTVKMADIADRLGVSTVTVSKALSGQKGVSEELREKIIDLANQMGYKARKASTEKNVKRSYNIGVLVSVRYLAAYDSFYLKMYKAVADYAAESGCFTLFEIISEEMEVNRQLPRVLGDKKVNGLIVIGKPGYNYEEFLRENVDIPLLFMDFYDKSNTVDCYVSDGFYGTYALTNYLFDKGHKDIAFVGTIFSTESITDRYLGYLKSLMEHGIEPKDEYLIKDRDEKNGLRDNYMEFNFPEKMPTALVCNCDFIASVVIKALRERGIHVPEDVSVVGFDNYMCPPELCDIEITTYAVDIDKMGKRGINTMIKHIDGAPYKKGIHIVEGHLIERNSVAERKKL